MNEYETKEHELRGMRMYELKEMRIKQYELLFCTDPTISTSTPLTSQTGAETRIKKRT